MWFHNCFDQTEVRANIFPQSKSWKTRTTSYFRNMIAHNHPTFFNVKQVISAFHIITRIIQIKLFIDVNHRVKIAIFSAIAIWSIKCSSETSSKGWLKSQTANSDGHNSENIYFWANVGKAKVHQGLKNTFWLYKHGIKNVKFHSQLKKHMLTKGNYLEIFWHLNFVWYQFEKFEFPKIVT